MKLIPLTLPLLGLSEAFPFGKADGRFTVAATNVMPFDQQDGRLRLASRQGARAVWDFESSTDLGSCHPIQWVGSARVYVAGTLTERTLIVHNGTIYWTDNLSTTVPTAIGSGPHFSGSTVQGCIFNQVAYFVDGTSGGCKKVDLTASTPSAASWTASAGTFPHVSSDYPTLIARFGARIALGGIAGAPNNWFLSVVGSATDFTAAATTSELYKSINGDSSALGFGQLGERITALIPFGEMGLLFGCERSIGLLTGDPSIDDTARIIMLSRSVGVPGPNAYTFGEEKDLWLAGTNGIYRITPADFRPDSVNRGTSVTAGRLDRYFQRVPWGSYAPCLMWDFERHGLWVFITPTGENRSGLHLFFDARNGGWWPQRFADPFWDGAVCGAYRDDAGYASPLMLLGGSWGRLDTFTYDVIRPYDGHPYGTATTTRTPETAVETFTTLLKVGPLASEDHDQLMLRCVSVHMDEWRYSEPDAAVENREYPVLRVVAGTTAEQATRATIDTDPIEVTRTAEDEVDGGDSTTSSWDATYDCGSSSTSSFDSDVLDGRIAAEPTGEFTVDDPQVDVLSLEWFNDGGWRIYFDSGSTIDDRVLHMQGPDSESPDPEYEQISGVVTDAANPAVFGCRLTGHTAERLSAQQQASAGPRVVSLGELQPGRSCDRNCRIRAGGLVLEFSATGYPMVLDTVAVGVEKVNRSRTHQWQG